MVQLLIQVYLLTHHLTINTLTEVEAAFQGGDYFKGNVKDIRVYNTALTDQELIELTTI